MPRAALALQSQMPKLGLKFSVYSVDGLRCEEKHQNGYVSLLL